MNARVRTSGLAFYVKAMQEALVTHTDHLLEFAAIPDSAFSSHENTTAVDEKSIWI